ncbi:MAG: hypothetical protein ACOVNY_05945, partial [Chitinophagaceae bacterium]
VETYYGATYQVDAANKKVIITKPTNSISDNKLKLGQIVVLGSQSTKSIPHTVYADSCTNLTFDNVVSFASTSFSFFETYCSGSKYTNCIVDRRPLNSDVKVRGFKRMRSGNADAFHSKRAAVGPSYVGCTARYNGDDEYAINGDYHFISETNGSILTVIAKGGGNNTLGFLVGDTVELTSYTGARIPNAKIVSVVGGRALNTTELIFFFKQNFVES